MKNHWNSDLLQDLGKIIAFQCSRKVFLDHQTIYVWWSRAIWSKSSDILKKIIRHFNLVIHKKFGDGQTEGLVQERCNSSALAVESRLSCTNPSRQFVMILNKSSTMSDGPMAFREHWNFIESTGYIKCFKMEKKNHWIFFISLSWKIFEFWIRCWVDQIHW